MPANMEDFSSGLQKKEPEKENERQLKEKQKHQCNNGVVGRRQRPTGLDTTARLEKTERCLLDLMRKPAEPIPWS